jgi:ubiquitin carboxyl-terminal hydrolase 5/13
VAHIRHGDKWVIFNDEKVCESQDPPHKMAYIYFYRRL